MKKRVIIPLGPDVSVREGADGQKYIDALIEDVVIVKLNEASLVAFVEGESMDKAPLYAMRKTEDGKLVMAHEWAGHECEVAAVARDAPDAKPLIEELPK